MVTSSDATEVPLLIEMTGISKDFPGVHALADSHFELRPGEIHALVGENGAGKSTLMKILAGVYRKDSGRVVVRGTDVDIPNPSAARRLGIRLRRTSSSAASRNACAASSSTTES